MNLKQAVADIQFPTTNEYYERTSADGYALLGAAKAILGMGDYGECWRAALARGKTIKENWPCGPVGAKVTVEAGTPCMYQLWACAEMFHHRLGLRCDGLWGEAQAIGQYDDGWWRYCEPVWAWSSRRTRFYRRRRWASSASPATRKPRGPHHIWSRCPKTCAAGR